jgi:putative membrane protein
MLYLIILSVALLVVVVFALQNAQAVTIRFLFWQLDSSLAILALAFTAAGVLIAELLRLTTRLLRWKRGRP